MTNRPDRCERIFLGSARLACWRWRPRCRELFLVQQFKIESDKRKVRFGATPKPARETRALPRARCAVSRELRTIFRVAHFPAERGDSIAQLIASFPILFASCVLALFCELRHFRWHHDFDFSFEVKNSIDSFPSIQPCACRSSIQFVFIHCAIRFAN